MNSRTNQNPASNIRLHRDVSSTMILPTSQHEAKGAVSREGPFSLASRSPAVQLDADFNCDDEGIWPEGNPHARN